MGGDDITEFLYVLLERINFPYRDVNLARWYDWSVMEDLKIRLCTLAEVGCTVQLYFTGNLNRVYRAMWRSIFTTLSYDNQARPQKSMDSVHMTKSS